MANGIDRAENKRGIPRTAAGRAAALLCAAALTVTAGGHSAFALAGETEDDRFTQSLMDRDNTYAAYRNTLDGLPEGTADIPLDIAAFRADGIKPAAYEGKAALLLTGEGESLRAVFSVDKGGVYELSFAYYPVPGSSREIELGLELDGTFPFSEAAAVILERAWRDETGIQTDPSTGNQYSPRQVESPQWLTSRLKNRDGKYRGAYRFYLAEGKHELKFTALQTAFAFGGCAFRPAESIPSYAEYRETYGGPADGDYRQTYEAERASLKSDQTLSSSGDRTSPNTTPYDVAKIRMNVIGRNWSSPAQWIEWEFTVPADGYYRFHFRYQQDAVKGLPTHRILTVDGKTPFQEAESVRFPYTEGWASAGLQDSDGKDAAVWLEAGTTHTLRLETTSGELTESVHTLDNVVYSLNELYRRIIMITGVSPDKYQDYNLDASVEGLTDTLAAAAAALRGAYADVAALSGGKGNQAELLSRFAYQLEDFVRESETIDLRLTEFKDNIGALSAWLLDIKQQPLLLDTFTVSSPGAALPRARDSVWDRVKHELSAFFISFVEDYSAVGFKEGRENITLWLNAGRDQAQVIKSMVSDMFTPRTGVGVNIKLVNASLVQARLSGNTPDVSIMQGRGQPVNLAARNALLPLDDFGDFSEVLARFQPSAATPYRLNGKTYALPDSQSFFMMFYRKDVFRDLELTPPETWEELREVSGTLQRNNMEVGLPYTSIDASGAVDAGMGSRNIFSALLLQSGGRVYSDGLSRTELSGAAAQQAFIDWTEFYRLYDMPLAYELYNRFRTGEMPIGIAGYTMYNQLAAAAPEIRGLWEMRPIPGTRGETGELDISQGGSGTAAMILRDTAYPEACWEFLKWWTSAEAQTRYGGDIEASMGVSARYPTSNREALQNVHWTRQETANLMRQWESVEEIPEAVGGYTLVRGLDNAFREAVLEGRNPREALLVWDRSINAEIHRKREEFRYDMD